MRLLIPALVLGIACGDKDPPAETAPPEDEDTGIGWPDNPGDDGTDEDGDGWTVEDGDCDDDDIYTNPARDEIPDDGADNDCDGRTDEKFSGLVTVQVGDGTILPTIHGIDDFGGGEWTVELDDAGISPYFMTAGLPEGWVVGDYANLILYEVDASGTTTELVDLSESHAAILGMLTHPDGYYLLLTVRYDELAKIFYSDLNTVTPGVGTMDTLVTWETETELYGFDIDRDPLTGRIGVFGFYGGFGIYDPDSGELDVRIPIDTSSDKAVYSGCHRDGGGWFAGAFATNGFGIYEFDELQDTWDQMFLWDSQWDPTFMNCEGDSGDFYVSANGASYPMVWRVLADGSQQAAFYESEITGGLTDMWDIYVTY